MTFVDNILEGNATIKDFDEYVETWHEADTTMSLEEWLGITKEEYNRLAQSKPSQFYDLLDSIVQGYSQNKVASALQRVKYIINRFK